MTKVKVKRKGIDTIVNEKIGQILCIILKEGKGSKWRWINDYNDKFTQDEHTYFMVDEGTYLKNTTRFMIFLEGVSTPMHHGYIERETVERTVIDRDTNEEKKVFIDKIKGLKFDSKLIDMLLNRNLADQFTRQHMDLPNLLIIVLLVVNVAIGFINVGMWFK